MNRDFTWAISASDDAEVRLTATDDGLVTLVVAAAGCLGVGVRLNHWERDALTFALEQAGRTAAGLLARRKRGAE
jgi:hypothetical protein